MNKREIKFRGQTFEDNFWIVGTVRFFNSKRVEIFDGSDSFYVIPETVGQYTGFKDCKGNEIYEGDILEYVYVRDGTQKKRPIVKFNTECGAWICSNGEYLCNILVEQHNLEWKMSQNWSINKNQNVLIVSNIHENPLVD